MKAPLIICLYVLAVTHCFAQYPLNFQPADIPHGRVEAVIIKDFLTERLPTRDTLFLLSKTTSGYNKNKQLVQSDYCSYIPRPHVGLDSLPVKTVYAYDGAGYLTGSQRYFTTGARWVKDVFSKTGTIVAAKEIYCPDSSQAGTDTLNLDAKGRIAKWVNYINGVGLFLKSYFTYDTAGRLIKEDTYRSDGSLMFEHTCKYNRDGDMIEDNNPNGDQILHTYSYSEYDNMHNWQVRIEQENGKSGGIQKRKISYYR